MLRRTLYTLLLVLVAAAAFAQDLSLRYEYWTDSDFDNRVSGSCNEQEVTFATSLRGLTPGLHSLNFRAREDDAVWGSIHRYLFMVAPDKTLDNIGYESWIDGDYNHRITGIASDSIITGFIDMKSLSPGLHCYNVRVQGADGVWSSVFRYLFMVTTNEHAGITRYESWMDGDYDHRTIVEQTEDSLTQTIDISGLADGVHCYNFRAQNADGIWGSVHRFLIFLAEPDASEMPASINYWIDESTDTLTQDTRGTQVSVTLDVSQLEPGTHTFNCYLLNVLGDTTDVYHFDFRVGYVEKPVVSRKNYSNTVDMRTATAEATIFYTLDGSKPTAESLRYTEPFEVTQNGIIKAVGVRDGWLNSDVTTFYVNWVAEPGDKTPWEGELAQLEQQGGSIGVSINALKDESTEQAVMEQRQRILCDTLRAMLLCCTLDVPEKTTAFKKEVVEVEDSLTEIYSVQVGIESEQARLRAVTDSLTLIEDTLRSQLAEATTKEEVERISNRITQLQQDFGTVKEELEALATRIKSWKTRATAQTVRMKTIENGIVESTVGIVIDSKTAYTILHRQDQLLLLRPDQLQRLHRYPQLQHLNLSGTTMENNTLPDEAFSGLQRLITAELPSDIVSYGSRLFADCPNMAAIVWPGSGVVSNRVLAGIDNPNLLLYVGSESQVRDVSVENIVVGGVAQHITLTDGDETTPNTSFYAPRAFSVKEEISYTHTYTQTTVVGECRGWETIALPFDVQTIVHETKGEAVPFLSYEAGKRPFWLCKLTEQGFEDASRIQAGVPYIISMPNSASYSPFYRLNGVIRFSSYGVTVPATTFVVGSKGTASFIPAFGRVAASPQVFALNVGEEKEGYAEGSVFVNDYRDVRPFQAYRTTTEAGVHCLSIEDDLYGNQTGIIGMEKPVSHDGPTYNLQGIRVQTPSKGVYIRDGKKIIKY